VLDVVLADEPFNLGGALIHLDLLGAGLEACSFLIDRSVQN
jgi:hypothetical protein